MYSAQVANQTIEPDYRDKENMEKLYAEELAKEVAASSQEWEQRDIPSGEDVAPFVETFLKWRSRAIESLHTLPTNVMDVACAALNQKGPHFSTTLYRALQLGHTPQLEKASFSEVDMLVEPSCCRPKE